MSRSGTYAWTPGVNRAKKPGPNNGDGFHAWHAPDQALNSGGNYYGPVFGAILAWGEMMVADDWFRAEYCRVIGLAGRPDNLDLQATLVDLALLGTDYDVPIFDTKEELVAEVQRHGCELDTALRPGKQLATVPNLKLGTRTPPASNLHPSYFPSSPIILPTFRPRPILIPLAFGGGCLLGAELVKGLLL